MFETRDGKRQSILPATGSISFNSTLRYTLIAIIASQTLRSIGGIEDAVDWLMNLILQY
jgi:hypothetical protein